jgi:aspartate aminotransferase-like enzyme
MPLKTRLFTPGPVEIPPRILRALSQVPPHHRTDVFRETLRRVTERLRTLHGTEGEVFLFAGSGTSAMEAAVVNVVAPGEKSLAIAGGKFGERWAKIVEAYGQSCEKLEIEWGQSVDPAEVERRLDADPAIRIVFATHSETSTGALHDVEALAKLTRPRGVRLVVDAVTSLGVHPVQQDAWGIDVMVCGSQKGLMLPPGIATVSLAPWAHDLIEQPRLPRFAFDLRKARKSAPLGETAFTPPVSLVLALEESLAMIFEEGLERVHTRHRELAKMTREGATRLGFLPFASTPSHAITALLPPVRVQAPDVVKRLREAHGMVVAGGQDRLKGRILRVGHMGAYDVADIAGLLAAMAECVIALAPRGALSIDTRPSGVRS